MARSIYIHVPFCRSKCRYCDFDSFAAPDIDAAAYCRLLRDEIGSAAGTLATAEAATLYFGGGTPSLLSPAQIRSVITAVRQHCHLDAAAEITLEANPGTVSDASLAGYLEAGVNRLSIGIQSLDDSELALLGRIHSAAAAREAVAAARRSGFTNISLDLMHSLPGQTLAAWEDTLQQALALQPQHISAYGLAIEENTPFADMLRSGEILPVDEELATLMFEKTAEVLGAAGFEHYEVSNFARSGCRSRHNQTYWLRHEYLGFGAGAHSFLRTPGFGHRWSNPADIGRYAAQLKEAAAAPAGELLSERDAMAEFFFLGLRMLEGVSLQQFQQEFGLTAAAAFPGVIERFVRAGLLLMSGDTLRLTPRGLLLANIVLADFTAST